jgi:hypothetical protein
MSGVRFFSGSRDLNKGSVAREILKLEMEKGGKLTSQERFKLIMRRKMAESKKTVSNGNKNGRKMSAKAENALKQVAAKKAAKEQKILRQSVIVDKKIFANGMVTKAGKVFDTAGNQIAVINKKNGKMSTNGGTALGMYKNKDRRTQAILVDAINKHSPYFMNLRKMQAMQAAGLDPKTGRPLNEDVINVHGSRGGPSAAMLGGDYRSTASMYFDMGNGGQSANHFAADKPMFFEGVDGPRTISNTAWGAMSNNVWGTFGENVWGGSGDNVWGTHNSDIFGNAGFALWGNKGPNIWGTGNGVNHLKSVGNMLRKLFGRVNKKTVANFRQSRQGAAAGPRSGASAARSVKAPVRGPSGPTGRR